MRERESTWKMSTALSNGELADTVHELHGEASRQRIYSRMRIRHRQFVVTGKHQRKGDGETEMQDPSHNDYVSIGEEVVTRKFPHNVESPDSVCSSFGFKTTGQYHCHFARNKMKSFVFSLFVASLLSCVAGMVHADEFAAQRADVLALGKLTKTPAMMDAEGFRSADGIRAIYFDALDYEGKSTKVFAWLGMPKTRAGKVPGIVLVHGGGGTAFRQWVEQWNERGFAAIAIAHEGQVERREAPRTWAKHAWPGPARSGHYQDSSKPLKDQWMYHAVADTILANSLLRSLPVDENKVGVMGVSWGGVITSTVMGIDSRFAFAIPTYGCGQMADVKNHWGAALGDNTFYREVWDPVHYLPQANMPSLWFSWPEDRHFPLDSQAASYRATSGTYMVSLLPGMKHSTRAAWTPPDSYAFAKSIVDDGKPWCLLVDQRANGEVLEVVFESTKPLDRAMLFSTSDVGYTGSRKWVKSDADLQKLESDGRWLVKAQIPVGATACFINVTSGDLTVSSRYKEMQ